MLFSLTGCSSDKEVLDKTITLSTGWGQYIKDFGIYYGILVYPLAQAINFLSQYMNVAWAMLTVVAGFNIITLYFDRKSSINSRKIELLKPEVKKLKEQYTDAGKDDEYAKKLETLYKKNNASTSLLEVLVPLIRIPLILSMYYAIVYADSILNGTIFASSLMMTPYEAVKCGNIPVLIIFILMGAAQFASSNINYWLSEDKKNKAMVKSMIWSYAFLIIILISSFRWCIALSLYWLISSSCCVLKVIITKKCFTNNVTVVGLDEENA